MQREVNLFKVVAAVLICIFAVVSFFDCLVCIEHSTIGGFDGTGGRYVTDTFYGNAQWMMLVLSVVQIVMLCFKKRWTRNIREALAVISAAFTLVFPLYLAVLRPGFSGGSYGYTWTPLGVLVLILSHVIVFYNFILLRIVDRKDQHICTEK